MFNCHAPAAKADAILLKIERRYEALLAEHGALDPSELPRALRAEMVRRAALETAAAANFPAANLEALDHSARSVFHPAFVPALGRVRLATKGGRDAFAMSRGVYAAVVLAAFGLPLSRRSTWRPNASWRSRVTTLTRCWSYSLRTKVLLSVTTLARRRFTSC